MDEKKGNPWVSGAIWDSLLSDEESDVPTEPVPRVPNELVQRTLAACATASDFELRRNADPATIANRRPRRDARERPPSREHQPVPATTHTMHSSVRQMAHSTPFSPRFQQRPPSGTNEKDT